MPKAKNPMTEEERSKRFEGRSPKKRKEAGDFDQETRRKTPLDGSSEEEHQRNHSP